MGLIHVLDTEVSNKIAAGEVVERPLSIVKELVENSIDAGASVITVEIRNGGISYIRVTDDGSGMSGEDAGICFLRHATSKIKTDDDLNAIYTLGFRGEALSSIGAVTKVKLFTKRREDNIGICVTCEGGEILSYDDAGAPNGTVIEISDLFYNTPARLKFLKKPATEAGYISDIMSRFIFAHPEISFKLIRDGKEILFSSGDNKLINSVYSVYGKDYAKNMLDVDYEYNGIHVTGVVGKGTLARANRNYETFFVNKRYIKSSLMIRALEEAYKNQIMISKFPTAILNIDIDVSNVDINVHPTKLECKFSNEQEIYHTVYNAVKKALYELPNVPEIELGKKDDSAKQELKEQPSLEDIYREEIRKSIKPDNNFKYKTTDSKPKYNDFDFWKIHGNGSQQQSDKPKENVYGNGFKEQSRPAIENTEPAEDESKSGNSENINQNQPYDAAKDFKQEEIAYTTEDESNNDVINTVDELEQITTDNDLSKEKEMIDTFAMIDFALIRSKNKNRGKMIVNDPNGDNKFSSGDNWDWQSYRDEANKKYREKISKDGNIFENGYFRVIGQLFETYILVEKGENLLIIDQHAAHERLNYEKLKEELESKTVTSQLLLEPVVVTLTGTEYSVFVENEELFYDLGFDVEVYGESAVIIRGVPGEMSWSDVEPLFLELLTQVADMKQELITESKQRLIYTISCKASIKANMKISYDEMQKLVSRVFALENINTCPHGRPIVISMSKKEIEKDFKRIV